MSDFDRLQKLLRTNGHTRLASEYEAPSRSSQDNNGRRKPPDTRQGYFSFRQSRLATVVFRVVTGAGGLLAFAPALIHHSLERPFDRGIALVWTVMKWAVLLGSSVVAACVAASGLALLMTLLVVRSVAPPIASYEKELYFDYTQPEAVAIASFLKPSSKSQVHSCRCCSSSVWHSMREFLHVGKAAL